MARSSHCLVRLREFERRWVHQVPGGRDMGGVARRSQVEDAVTVAHPPAVGKASAVPLALLMAFAVIWVALAIAPWYRADWMLENALVVIAVPLLVATYRRLRFSNASYVALFVFLVLHEVGAHYTYAQVPYDRWVHAWFGVLINQAFAFPRNEYDRFVHFMYGVLVTPMVFELFEARARARGIWRWIFPVAFIVSNSALFELVEWFAAEHFGGGLGVAYLGTQGDVWDAQSDMLLAMIGSIVSIAAIAIMCRYRARRSGGNALG